MKKIHLNYFV